MRCIRISIQFHQIRSEIEANPNKVVNRRTRFCQIYQLIFRNLNGFPTKYDTLEWNLVNANTPGPTHLHRCERCAIFRVLCETIVIVRHHQHHHHCSSRHSKHAVKEKLIQRRFVLFRNLSSSGIDSNIASTN